MSNISDLARSTCGQFNLDESLVDKLCEYSSLIYKYNRAVRLTSFGILDEWIVSHFEDCLRGSRIILKLNPGIIVDCGSGNGLPGIVLGILSNIPLILIERDQRKGEFLRRALKTLKLDGQIQTINLTDFEFSTDQNLLFTYRGLGPINVLQDNLEKFNQATHVRFISSNQDLEFESSKKHLYTLSDGSERALEITT